MEDTHAYVKKNNLDNFLRTQSKIIDQVVDTS